MLDSIETRVRAALLVVTPVIVGPRNEIVGLAQPAIKNNEIIIKIFFNIKVNEELPDSLQKRLN